MSTLTPKYIAGLGTRIVIERLVDDGPFHIRVALPEYLLKM